jgi:hypoxanthine phosphoribosyltransferase
MAPPTVLITEHALAARIRELAAELRAALPNDDIHFVCVLKGAFMFLSDLVRALDDRVTLDFIAVSSYGASTKTSGEVRLVRTWTRGWKGGTSSSSRTSSTPG